MSPEMTELESQCQVFMSLDFIEEKRTYIIANCQLNYYQCSVQPKGFRSISRSILFS